MFSDSISSYKSQTLGSYELDIYIPSLHIGIEYDGERWHQNSEKDLQKNQKCADLMITLIRIREPHCPILSDNISIDILLKNKKSDISDAIKKVFEEITRITGVEYSFEIDLARDNSAILSLLDISEKDNSLFSVFPDISKEWDYEKNKELLPSKVSIGSDKKAWWLCPLGHSYSASISSRIRGRGCTVCAGKTVLRGFNDFETHCPELAKDWDYGKNSVTPDSVAYGSDKKYWWICSNGHSYECSINNRRAGQSCYYCSGKRVLAGFNDLCTTHPTIANQWCSELNTILPNEVNAGSHKRVWWECKTCGHRWLSYVYNRCLNNAGCPKCSGRMK